MLVEDCFETDSLAVRNLELLFRGMSRPPKLANRDPLSFEITIVLLGQLVPILGTQRHTVHGKTIALPDDILSMEIPLDLTFEELLFHQGVIGPSIHWIFWIAGEGSSKGLISPCVDFKNEFRIAPVPSAGLFVIVEVLARNRELASLILECLGVHRKDTGAV